MLAKCLEKLYFFRVMDELLELVQGTTKEEEYFDYKEYFETKQVNVTSS